MQRRQQTSGGTAAMTDIDGHQYSGGFGLRPSPAEPTGSTSHRIGVGPGIAWWVRPTHATKLPASGGRHRRVADPPRSGRVGRLWSWLGMSGIQRTDGHRPCPAIA